MAKYLKTDDSEENVEVFLSHFLMCRIVKNRFFREIVFFSSYTKMYEELFQILNEFFSFLHVYKSKNLKFQRKINMKCRQLISL